MPIGRYTKGVLTIIALCLLVLTARAWGPRPVGAAIGDTDEGERSGPPSPPKPPEKIPRAWGRLAAVTHIPGGGWAYLYFEATDGTIRIVRSSPVWRPTIERK